MERRFPEDVRARMAFILSAVSSGDYEHEFWPITLTSGARTLVVLVSADALKIDGVRVNVDCFTQMRLAPMLNAYLMTPKIADLRYLHANNYVLPKTMPINATVAGMVEHSDRVDRALGKNKIGICDSIGKHWVVAKSIIHRPEKACNYGWYYPEGTLKGVPADNPVTPMRISGHMIKMIQTLGYAHNRTHVDYSQIACFMYKYGILDNKSVDLEQIVRGEDHWLLSHEGVLPGLSLI